MKTETTLFPSTTNAPKVNEEKNCKQRLRLVDGMQRKTQLVALARRALEHTTDPKERAQLEHLVSEYGKCSSRSLNELNEKRLLSGFKRVPVKVVAHNKSAKHYDLHISGLARCGKAICPVCSPSLSKIRTAKATAFAKKYIKELAKKYCFFITLNTSHGKGTSLEQIWFDNTQLWDAIHTEYRTMSRNYQRDLSKAELDYGMTRAIEATFTKNGLNLHEHVFVAVNTIQEAKKIIQKFWEAKFDQEQLTKNQMPLAEREKLVKFVSIPKKPTKKIKNLFGDLVELKKSQYRDEEALVKVLNYITKGLSETTGSAYKTVFGGRGVFDCKTVEDIKQLAYLMDFFNIRMKKLAKPIRHTVVSELETEYGQVAAEYIGLDDGQITHSIDDEFEAARIAKVAQTIATVVDVKTKTQVQESKPLFNQLDILKILKSEHKIPVKEGKEILDSLNSKGFISEPTSEGRFISCETASRLMEVLPQIAADLKIPFSQKKLAPRAKIINDNRANGLRGEAIVPLTGDISLVSREEKRVLKIIVRRVLANFFPDYVFERHTFFVNQGGVLFKSISRTDVQRGFMRVDPTYNQKLPEFTPEKGQVFQAETEVKTEKLPSGLWFDSRDGKWKEFKSRRMFEAYGIFKQAFSMEAAIEEELEKAIETENINEAVLIELEETDDINIFLRHGWRKRMVNVAAAAPNYDSMYDDCLEVVANFEDSLSEIAAQKVVQSQDFGRRLDKYGLSSDSETLRRYLAQLKWQSLGFKAREEEFGGNYEGVPPPDIGGSGQKLIELDGSHWISAVRLLDEALELREITVTREDGAERKVLVNETSDWPLPEVVFNGEVGYLGVETHEFKQPCARIGLFSAREFSSENSH